MSNDIFELIEEWQAELQQRHRLRESPLNPWTVEFADAAMLELYKRAWYNGGRKTDFLIALVVNLTNPHVSVNTLLRQNTNEFNEAFFQIWALALEQNSWSIEHLRMLIVFFHPEWIDYYPPLLAALSPQELKMLSSKTADPHLRTLIDQQLKQKASTEKDTDHLASTPAMKNLMRQHAQKYLHEALQHDEQLPLLLKAGECLFAAGDIDEVMWLAHTLSIIDPKPQASWKDQPLWGRSFPLFALSAQPENPYGLGRKLYEQFTDGRADNSIAYLDLAESLFVGMTFSSPFSEVEIYRKVNRLLQVLPGEAALLYFQSQLPPSITELDQTLPDLACSCLDSDPFTAFLRLEMNRFLLHQGKTMSLTLRHTLVGLYRKLYHWLPLPQFWNLDILASLLPAAEHSAYQLELYPKPESQAKL